MKKAELRFTGSGGQGVIMATIILAEAAYADKLQAVQSQSYGPEARGGLCKAECIIDEKPITYTKVVLPNLLLSLTQASLDKYVGSLQDQSVVVVDSSITVPEEVKAHPRSRSSRIRWRPISFRSARSMRSCRSRPKPRWKKRSSTTSRKGPKRRTSRHCIWAHSWQKKP